MKSPLSGCVICGEKKIERNHLGGQNFIAWFTMPFCIKHHRQFHALVAAAGVNLEYCPDQIVRMIRALKAMLIGAFMALETIEEAHLSSKTRRRATLEEGTNDV
jgi:hypothetical protein